MEDSIIKGLPVSNAKELMNVILQYGESTEHFKFSSRDIKNKDSRVGKRCQIHRSNNDDFYFYCIRFAKGDTVSYTLSYKPKNKEQQTEYHPDTFNNFEQVLRQFRIWMDCIKLIESDAQDLKQMVQTIIHNPSKDFQTGITKEEHKDRLLKLLPIDANGYLVHKDESDSLEFKSVIQWDGKQNLRSRLKYIKTLAGFGNNKGGYIVFGIEDKKKCVVGINSDVLNDVDITSVNQLFNFYFTVALAIEKIYFELFGLPMGAFFVNSAGRNRPIMCKNKGTAMNFDTNKNETILADGEVYYRFSGYSDKILSGDLQRLMNERSDNTHYEDKSEVLQEKNNYNHVNLVLQYQKNVRRSDIAPRWNVASQFMQDQINELFENLGGYAEIIKHETFDDNNARVSVPVGIIDKGKLLIITVFAGVQVRNENILHINLFYRNQDKDLYSMEIFRTGMGRIQLKEPVLLSD